MNKFEVIPHRYWFNRITGARASLYGAAPWTNDADARNWERVIDGWTIRNNQTGTVGTARTPVASTRRKWCTMGAPIMATTTTTHNRRI